MSDVIEVNAGYKLVGRMREMPRKMCFVCGRQGDTISVLLVSGVTTAEVKWFDREFAQVQTPDGVYNLMPCNKSSDVDEVADIVGILQGGH